MNTANKAKYEKLEQYRRDLSQAERELINNEQIVSDLKTRNVKLSGDIKHFRHLIMQLEKDLDCRPLQVSDHVVLRYMERKMKLPIEDIRQEISERLECYDKRLGNTDNFLGFVINGNVVVTYKGND